MNYRDATSADAPLLAELNHQLIADEGHRNPMSVAELETRMRGWLTAEYAAVLFEDESGPAGYALYCCEPDYVYLRQFFVQRDRRRQNVGQAALQWLLVHRWPPESRIRIDVLVRNTAGIAFWRALGFADYCLTMERSGAGGGDTR